VLTARLPPVIEIPPSKTRLPPVKVTLVPLPILRSPGQSIHQLPAAVMVPAALQL
jgi:hypothetical protein